MYCVLARRSPLGAAGDCARGLRAGAGALGAGLAAAGSSAASPPDAAGDELAVAIRNATSDYAEVRKERGGRMEENGRMCPRGRGGAPLGGAPAPRSPPRAPGRAGDERREATGVHALSLPPHLHRHPRKCELTPSLSPHSSQLSALVRAWVRRPDAPLDEPAAFAAFLAIKARRPHRSLERALDWVLWVYRTLWPVLVR